MAASGFKGGLIWIFLVFLNTKHYFYCCQVIKNLKNPKSIVNIIVLAKVSYSIEKSFLNSPNTIFERLGESIYVCFTAANSFCLKTF